MATWKAHTPKAAGDSASSQTGATNAHHKPQEEGGQTHTPSHQNRVGTAQAHTDKGVSKHSRTAGLTRAHSQAQQARAATGSKRAGDSASAKARTVMSLMEAGTSWPGAKRRPGGGGKGEVGRRSVWASARKQHTGFEAPDVAFTGGV